ncbi:3',5'-cyclic-AMP phosphodiesterase [Gilvimarinus sp. SDUM040013]|uniref:3',5'-cyclic-AMP phosphodiesterase n=1 Tax=Gilvimarinus gilvus TaxID=3058038 RepID=A0ABU4RV48_9GAMM|nr:3',5'-cyclic-AMP phosphodiesterase [Gilvimarinus sp. SDUM040013]MDO3387885.1 3',5'-cyclic-AMP phosphodiesterase [Gilvimarinus sp. SDUM040013]MDX6848744.1 3',5'-cyclic-AMP phosphodiesterase [Gilvimarinus sp. SDUM040013]
MAGKVSTTIAGAKPMRLVHITDTHLGMADGETLLGLNTDQSLKDVLELIQREQPHIDAMVCTGDIASSPEPDCYRRYIDTVLERFACPQGWLPGNHDSTEVMLNLDHPHLPVCRTMDMGAWLIVLLDSSVPGHVHGELTASELGFLDDTLSANADRPTLVMLHHQPVAVGSGWIDQYIVRNSEQLFAVIERHSQVKALSWGHVHQLFDEYRGGVQLLATPSTCVQFKPDCDDFTVDTAMPGYRWYDLYPDGRMETGIARVTGKDYVIDYRSAGY